MLVVASAQLTPLTVIEIAVAILGLVGLLTAAGWVVFRGTVAKTSVDNYKEAYESMEASNTALAARVQTLETDVKEAKAHAERCDSELASQRSAYNALAEQVRGTAAVEKLGERIDVQFEKLIATVKASSEGDAAALDSMGEALGHFVTDLRNHLGLKSMDRRENS